MTTKIRRIVPQLSPPLTVLVVALFAAGVISGWFQYLGRSPSLEKHVPGTSAWWQQLAVAVLAGTAFGYARWRHSRRFGRDSDRLWLLAPLGKPAARRAARTVPGALRGQPGFARALVALPPAGLFFYCFWRAGLQVSGGLDPNSTVNAWGGPTYLGAMACHYLDCCVLMAAAAWLLDRILLPDPAITTASSNARAGSESVPATREGAESRSDSRRRCVKHAIAVRGADLQPGARRCRNAAQTGQASLAQQATTEQPP